MVLLKTTDCNLRIQNRIQYLFHHFRYSKWNLCWEHRPFLSLREHHQTHCTLEALDQGTLSAMNPGLSYAFCGTLSSMTDGETGIMSSGRRAYRPLRFSAAAGPQLGIGLEAFFTTCSKEEQIKFKKTEKQYLK